MNQVGDWYATISPENKYQYNGKELNEELDLNWNDYGARWYDPAIGRWNAVDPLAELDHNYPFTPYHFVANNPISNIDLDGQDWYKNSDGQLMWRKTKGSEGDLLTDNDGVEWTNVGNELLLFNGDKITLFTQSENEDGELTLSSSSYDAVSGRPLGDGSFSYSDLRQAQKSEGPIPEGDYTVNPSEIQNFSDLSFAQKAAALVGRGQWPGGKRSWGENRAWINPSSVEVTDPETGETVIRTDMSIHGGSIPGSAGCIDCHKNSPALFNQLKKSKSSSILLRVKYPKSKKK